MYSAILLSNLLAYWVLDLQSDYGVSRIYLWGLTFELTGPLRRADIWARLFISQMAARRNGSG